MNFDKVINNMQELQNKIKIYEEKNKNIDNAIISIKKDILKLEKKLEKETDDVNKMILKIKVLIMENILNRFTIE